MTERMKVALRVKKTNAKNCMFDFLSFFPRYQGDAHVTFGPGNNVLFARRIAISRTILRYIDCVGCCHR